MSDSSKMTPAVKLTLSRETVKNLSVRTDVRTGYIWEPNATGTCVPKGGGATKMATGCASGALGVSNGAYTCVCV